MDNQNCPFAFIPGGEIDTYFQPIVLVENTEVLGYEALSRGPSGSGVQNPVSLISEAKSHNVIRDFDEFLKANSVKHAAVRGISKLLFLNTEPVAVYENPQMEAFIASLTEAGIRPERIVLEIPDQSVICKVAGFADKIAFCREKGFRICMENVDSMGRDIYTLAQIRPDYIKIDRSLVRGIDREEDKQAEINTCLEVAKTLQATVIAAGVETEDELSTLKRLRVPAVQGNLIARPNPQFQDVNPQAAAVLAAGRMQVLPL